MTQNNRDFQKVLQALTTFDKKLYETLILTRCKLKLEKDRAI